MAANRGLYGGTDNRALFSTPTGRMLYNVPATLTFTMGTYRNISSSTIGSTTVDLTSPYVFSPSELVTVVGNFKTSVQSASMVSANRLHALMELYAGNNGYVDGSAGEASGTIKLFYGAAKITRTDTTGLAVKRIELDVDINNDNFVLASFGGKSQVDMVDNDQTVAYALFRTGGSFEVVALSEEPTTAEEIYDAEDVLATIDVATINTNADLAGLSVYQTDYWYGHYGAMGVTGTYNEHKFKVGITDETFLDGWARYGERWIGVRFKTADIPTETSYQSAVPLSRTAAQAGAMTKDTARLLFGTGTVYGYGT